MKRYTVSGRSRSVRAHGTTLLGIDRRRGLRQGAFSGAGRSREPERGADGEGEGQAEGSDSDHHGGFDAHHGEDWPEMAAPQLSDEGPGMMQGYLDPDETPAARHRADHEEQWAPVRRALLDEYLICSPQNKLRMERSKEAVRLEAVAAIAEACAECRHCGRADGLHPRDEDAHVLWVGSSYTFELPVPICFCEHCKGETAAQPLEVGCFPSTPSRAWDLCSAPRHERPLWFDLEMLEVRVHRLCMPAQPACKPTAVKHLQSCLIS